MTSLICSAALSTCCDLETARFGAESGESEEVWSIGRLAETGHPMAKVHVSLLEQTRPVSVEALAALSGVALEEVCEIVECMLKERSLTRGDDGLLFMPK